LQRRDGAAILRTGGFVLSSRVGLGDMATDELTVREKIAYGYADFGYGIAFSFVGLYLWPYLSTITQVGVFLAGMVLLAGKVWDAVTDPLVGALSDRTRTRWGRRRPWLLFGAVPFGLTFVAIWLLPTDFGKWDGFAYFVVVYMLHATAYTCVAVPHGSLTPELTRDYDARTGLTSYRMAFSIAGVLVGSTLLPLIVGGEHARWTQLGFVRVAGICAIAMISGPLVVFFGCRERHPQRVVRRVSILEGFRLVLRNRPFSLALSMYLAAWVGLSMTTGMFVFYFNHWLKFGDELTFVLLVTFVTAGLMLPVWVRVSARFGKRAAYIAGMSAYALVGFATLLLAPSTTQSVWLFAVGAGIGISAIYVIPWSIIPDCIEYDELKTGQRREGTFYGFVTFAQKLAAAIGIFIASSVLKLTEYEGSATPSASVVWAIRLVFGPVPACVVMAGVIAAVFYPITKREHERIRAALAAGAQE
jgi:GPH family glycoside/pentoside/hexuronide:cation symporter